MASVRAEKGVEEGMGQGRTGGCAGDWLPSGREKGATSGGAKA